jgi:transcription initiation factor TFIID TATA-box-binding protein
MPESIVEPIKTNPENSLVHNRVNLRTENVVGSVDLGISLDLERLLSQFKDIEKKDNFPGLIVKISIPRATILVFKSGKLVITGVKSIKNFPVVLNKILRRLHSININIEGNPEIKIQNIVFRGDFYCNINLDLASIHLNRAIYEPEVFPGLIYRVQNSSICFLIFSSGKFICTGGKKEEEIKEEVRKLGKTLKINQVFKARTSTL